jgi:hypothetical protein
LDVFPLDAGVGQRQPDRVGRHLHGGLTLEAAERVQTRTDDGDVVHERRSSSSLRSASSPARFLLSVTL